MYNVIRNCRIPLKGYGGTNCGVYPVFTGRESFSRTRQLTSETGRGFYIMGKLKTSICALLVTTSVAGYSNIAAALTIDPNKISKNNILIFDEILAAQDVKENNRDIVAMLEEEKLFSAKADEAKLIAAQRAEEAELAAKKAEEERLAAAKKAEEEKLAAAKKAEEAKIAAEKAKKEKLAAKKAEDAKKTAAAKTVSQPTVSRGSTGVTAASAGKAQEIIEYAKQFMGVKYVFGGSSPKGFDCSGFTMYVFNKFGISLPHSAKAQAEIGAAVSKSELIPGDLVFFTTYKPGISHVGIYIGDGNFLEASSSRGIAITKLSSSYYKNRYMGATRILN